MTPCTRLAYFGSRVSVSLPDCFPGRITTAPSVVASFVLARTGRVSSGSSCSSRKDPSGAVRTGTPPSANPIGFGLTRWTEAPSTGFPAPSTTTPSSATARGSLRSGQSRSAETSSRGQVSVSSPRWPFGVELGWISIFPGATWTV